MSIVSFAEESCWDGEKFRAVRREIVFVLNGFAIVPGKSIRREFRSDFGLWYDQEDEWLINLLKREVAGVDWEHYVFFKKLDHTAILIIDPDHLPGKVVGSIYPRGRTRQKLSRENTGGNVVPISHGKVCRANRVAREAAKRDRRRGRDKEDQPEGS